MDRVCRMYYRDRNHPSITMWSLGNESGGYKCQDICYMFLNGMCPEIPVHYEALSEQSELVMMLYPRCTQVHKTAKKQVKRKEEASISESLYSFANIVTQWA